jgi:hypothetical protein
MPRIATLFNNSVDMIPFDFYELVAAVAPRPLFSNSPYTDFNFNVSGVFATLPKVRPVWDLFDGASSSLHVTFPAGGCMAEGGDHDCGHDFPAGECATQRKACCAMLWCSQATQQATLFRLKSFRTCLSTCSLARAHTNSFLATDVRTFFYIIDRNEVGSL